ncbi:MAG: hypothetical protein ACYTBJ_25930 [Planctomycetota bacterium]|jgi:hypothetical protein
MGKTAVSTATGKVWNLDIPAGTITRIRMPVTGGTGRAALPATKASLSVWSAAITTHKGMVQTPVSISSTWTDLATYEGDWYFDSGTVSVAVAPGDFLLGSFVSESGANAQAGFQIWYWEVTMTLSDLTVAR